MKWGQILADNDIGWFQRKQPSSNFEFTPGGGVLLEIRGGGMPPGSSIPDPISDQKM